MHNDSVAVHQTPQVPLQIIRGATECDFPVASELFEFFTCVLSLRGDLLGPVRGRVQRGVEEQVERGVPLHGCDDPVAADEDADDGNQFHEAVSVRGCGEGAKSDSGVSVLAEFQQQSVRGGGETAAVDEERSVGAN